MTLRERYVKATKEAQEKYPTIDEVDITNTKYNIRHLRIAKIFKDRAKEDFETLSKSK